MSQPALRACLRLLVLMLFAGAVALPLSDATKLSFSSFFGVLAVLLLDGPAAMLRRRARPAGGHDAAPSGMPEARLIVGRIVETTERVQARLDELERGGAERRGRRTRRAPRRLHS